MTDAESGDVDESDGLGAKGPLRARTTWLVVGLVAVAGGVPLAVALGVLHSPRWYPLLDLAQTELRVRDVGGRQSPLVGLAGRITGDDGLQGSHPGPLSFWALAPFYTLFGRTAWALQAAAASLNLLAMGTAVWIAHRRGGVQAALGATLLLGILMRAYAADWLTEAWNPYMPMMWWVVFLLAVWSVLCDDLVLLPVAVFAGSFCAQTHIPYLGLVVGVGGFMVAVLAWRAWQRRRAAAEDGLEGTSGSGRHLLRWVLASLGLLVLLWLPPLIDQAIHDRGNMTLIEENFTRGEPVVGVRKAAEVFMGNLDPTTLARDHKDSHATATGSIFNVPALLLLLAWAGAVATAWRRRYRDLLKLHAVLGVALVLGLVSISRIFDLLWYYLVLWSWGIKTLLILATAWTYLRAWYDRATSERRQQLTRWGSIGLAAAIVAVVGAFTYNSAHTERPAASESDTLAVVTPKVVARLRASDAPGGGKDGRYLVEWNQDALAIGSQGFGFLLELERQGFEVGVTKPMATGAVAHRVRDAKWASAKLEYVIGERNVKRWRATPGAVELVYYEPRTAAEQRRFDRIHDEAVAELRGKGLDKLVESLDSNLLATGIQKDTPPDVAHKIGQLMDLGMPTAVFAAPPEAAPPLTVS